MMKKLVVAFLNILFCFCLFCIPFASFDAKSYGLYVMSLECPQSYVDSAEHPMQLRMENSSIVAEIDGKTYTLYTYPQNALPTSSLAARSAD